MSGINSMKLTGAWSGDIQSSYWPFLEQGETYMLCAQHYVGLYPDRISFNLLQSHTRLVAWSLLSKPLPGYV